MPLPQWVSSFSVDVGPGPSPAPNNCKGIWLSSHWNAIRWQSIYVGCTVYLATVAIVLVYSESYLATVRNMDWSIVHGRQCIISPIKSIMQAKLFKNSHVTLWHKSLRHVPVILYLLLLSLAKIGHKSNWMQQKWRSSQESDKKKNQILVTRPVPFSYGWLLRPRPSREYRWIRLLHTVATVVAITCTTPSAQRVTKRCHGVRLQLTKWCQWSFSKFLLGRRFARLMVHRAL